MEAPGITGQHGDWRFGVQSGLCCDCVHTQAVGWITVSAQPPGYSSPYWGNERNNSLGYEFDEKCPKSYVVTSLKMRVGDFVDQMQTVCSQFIM